MKKFKTNMLISDLVISIVYAIFFIIMLAQQNWNFSFVSVPVLFLFLLIILIILPYVKASLFFPVKLGSSNQKKDKIITYVTLKIIFFKMIPFAVGLFYCITYIANGSSNIFYYGVAVTTIILSIALLLVDIRINRLAKGN